jgi:hypothetical protein
MFQQLGNFRWPAARSTAIAIFLLYAVLLSGLVTGCAAKLSPDYDKVTFASLSDLNVKTETLFASLSGGGSTHDFPTFQATYAQLIGGFSAARISTSNRQTPPLSASPQVKALCGSEPESCVNPTPYHLEKVITLLTKMRNTHQSGKLPGELVAGFNGAGGFKGQYEIEMGRVLAFESALQRTESSGGN